MKQEKGSVFTRIFQLFFPKDDIEAIKKRHLKVIAKDISKSKFSKWYKSGAQELLPAAGRFFYEIYTVVGPAQPLLSGSASSKVLKAITVEQSFSKQQQELRNRLHIDVIEKRSESLSVKELTAQVKHDLKLFLHSFDDKKIKEIDTLYQHLNEFIQLVLFDYYYLLKKFDTALPEHRFSYTPNYSPATGSLAVEELKDFAAILYGLSFEANWEKVFEIITAHKNVQPVNIKEWKKTIAHLQELRRSNILERLIQHISETPSYSITISVHNEKITNAYIKKMKHDIETTLKKIAETKKTSTAATLAQQIFGNEVPSGTRYYHTNSNTAFKKRNLAGYLYPDALNYLKSFLVDYFKSDIRTLADLLFVRGQWSHPERLSEYTDSYHTLIQLSTTVVEFDESLSEASDMAVRFRTLLSRMEREPEAAARIKRYLSEVNGSAADILKTGVKHIIVLGNAIKACITDYDKPHRSLLRNWKEIEHHADRPIRHWMEDAYKKMYHFITLERILLSKEESL